MLVAPPIGTTKMPLACRSRPARSAKVCTAAWSLIPSTSTTAHEPGSLRARAAAANATSSMSSSLAAMQRSTDRIYTTHVGSLALLPGVISHATSIVEHPDTIADRIVRFAELVGRENVVASADCGFSSQATYRPEIHPQIVWAKLESLAEGARRATARLWA